MGTLVSGVPILRAQDYLH